MSQKSFTPPKVTVGMTVLWYRGRNDRVPCPAVVMHVGDRALDLKVNMPHTHDQDKGGARHLADPELDRITDDVGCWELTERDKQIDQLLSEMGTTPLKLAK